MDKRLKKAVLRNLIKARALIDAGWTKGQLSRKVKGEDGKTATQYCMLGAIKKADGMGEQRALTILGESAAELYPKRSSLYMGRVEESTIYRFNDNRLTRKEQVLRVFDKAIKKVEALDA